MDNTMLTAAGLTNGESRVYIALLHLGESTTGPIIESSGITGSKVYEILDRLIAKGLVSYVTREKTKYFSSAPPSRILDFMDSQESEFKLKKSRVKDLIPSLEESQKSLLSSQSAQVFEGFEGIKTAFKIILESLKPGESYSSFSVGDEISEEKISLFFDNYHMKRIEKGISVRLIVFSSMKDKFKSFKGLKELKLRFSDNKFPTGLILFNDYVLTFSFVQEPIAFLMKSPIISNSYNAFFEGMWKQAKK